VATAVGSALALLFDGNRGKQRRKQLQDRAMSFYKKANRGANSQVQQVAGAAYGNAVQSVQSHEPDNPNPDDNTLRDRIESEVFGNPQAPKGEYNLNVVNGIATIRGQVNSQADISKLVEMIGNVPNVRGVESLLHTPGTDAPNKESAIHASEAS
jgi:osmotically-inducible protein OsmY